MKHKAEQLWNKIWTSQATPRSLLWKKERKYVADWNDGFTWVKVPGWLPDFLSVLVFFVKSISKALLTVVGRVVHTHVFLHSPCQEHSDTSRLAHARELWAVILLTAGTSCLMCTVAGGWPRPARVIGAPERWDVTEQFPCRQLRGWCWWWFS